MLYICRLFIGEGPSRFVNTFIGVPPVVLLFFSGAVEAPSVTLLFFARFCFAAGVLLSGVVNLPIFLTFIVVNLSVSLTFIGAGSSRYVNPFFTATPVTLLFFARPSFAAEVPLSGVVNLLVSLTFIVVHLPVFLTFIGDGSSSFVNSFIGAFLLFLDRFSLVARFFFFCCACLFEVCWRRPV